MTTVEERLRAIVEIADPERKKIATPFRMVYAGQKWTAATDGHCFAAVLGAADDLRTDGPDAAAIIRSDSKWTPVSGADLRAFAGKMKPHTKKCGECEGAGTIENFDCPCEHCHEVEHTCGDCGGTKTMPTDPDKCAVFGICMDRRLLARVLASAPIEEPIEIGAGGKEDAILFRAPGWLAAIMPVRYEVAAKLPAFPALAKQAEGSAP